MSLLLHTLRPNDLFLDIGANLGSYSLLASGICGSKSVAFEPIVGSFNELRNNVELNNLLGKINLLNLAVGKEDSEITLTTNVGVLDHVITDPENYSDDQKTKVQLITLDTFLHNKSFYELEMWKIDVEGFEYEVLSGAKKSLTDPSLKVILIETNGLVNRYGKSIGDLHQLLISFGFSVCKYDPFKREISLIEFPTENNSIYLRDIDFIVNRLKNGPIFKKFGVEF